MAPRPQPQVDAPTPAPHPSGRALASAFARHGPEVFALARRLLADVLAAEAVTCEVFVRFAREGDPICADRESMRACLLAACHRRCTEDMRSRRASLTTGARPDEACPTADPPDETFTLRTRTLLEMVPGDAGRAITLTYFWGRTYAEAAEALGTSGDAVKSGVRTALRRLHEERVGAGD